MMKTSAKLTTLVPLVIALSGCGSGGGGDNNPPPPVSTPKWTWVSGSDMANKAGIYGIKGTAAPSNVPGAREAANSWVDSSGQLWLFGGFGYDSVGSPDYLLNDLWKYNPTTLEWTWVSGSDVSGQAGVYGIQGVADPANVPGARYGPYSWRDAQGKFWFFGGLGMDSAGNFDLLNDLWKFDPGTLEWTWVSGSPIGGQLGVYGTRGTADPSNIPGGRFSGVSSVDAQGHFWLFAGLGQDANRSYYYHLGDLWKFDPATLEWTWMSGSNIIDQSGVYGTKGVADPANIPGARRDAVSWSDSGGNLWLFGGYGISTGSFYGELNDLWKYDVTTLEWTWMSGSNLLRQTGIYGTKGTASASNVPGGRFGAVSWRDAQGKFWLFGGDGYNGGLHNDLWKYDPTTLEWTWVSGSNTQGQGGVYGTKGIASASNVPGARCYTVSWLDPSGNLWLFGGECWDSVGYQRVLFNDLWKCTR